MRLDSLLLNLRQLKDAGGFYLENKRQTIVPVTLQSDPIYRSAGEKKQPTQKLVAQLKRNQTELLIYEGIKPSTLRVLLAEMSSNETR